MRLIASCQGGKAGVEPMEASPSEYLFLAVLASMYFCIYNKSVVVVSKLKRLHDHYACCKDVFKSGNCENDVGEYGRLRHQIYLESVAVFHKKKVLYGVSTVKLIVEKRI